MGIPVGQEVIVEVRFTRERTNADPLGSPERIPVNVTNEELRVRQPDGTETTLTPSNLPDPKTGDDGYYMAPFVPTLAGRHHFVGEGDITGGHHAVDEGSFYVEPRLVP